MSDASALRAVTQGPALLAPRKKSPSFEVRFEFRQPMTIIPAK
jgi:hypothetical protein